jgi:orotate phosphoribosyltransferase
VISAGTSVRESVDIIRAAGAEPAAVLIALDRRERGGNANEVTEQSAVQQVQSMFGIPVLSIASLDDVVAFLEQSGHAGELAAYRSQLAAYRERYGV